MARTPLQAHTETDLVGRVNGLDWPRLGAALDEWGYALTPALLSPDACRLLAAYYDDADRFRKTIDMQRFRFGLGQYRYFADPLPPTVRALRAAFYPHLAAIANDWAARLGEPARFPVRFADFRRRCEQAGQVDPTPLLLRYESGGYNCLHQDVYGDIAFPLQLTALLSAPAREFTGGEFLLVETRPRMQSRGEAVTLSQGQFIVFPNQSRPVKGARGEYRAKVRHGVSRIHRGVRMTLGIIFHDAA